MQDVLMTLVATSQSFATSLVSRVPNAGNAMVTIPRRASIAPIITSDVI
jgi:hypothetical protein